LTGLSSKSSRTQCHFSPRTTATMVSSLGSCIRNPYGISRQCVPLESLWTAMSRHRNLIRSLGVEEWREKETRRMRDWPIHFYRWKLGFHLQISNSMKMLEQSHSKTCELFETSRSITVTFLKIQDFRREWFGINLGTVRRILRHMRKFQEFEILSQGGQKIQISVLWNAYTIKFLGHFRPAESDRKLLILHLLFPSLFAVCILDTAAGWRYLHFLGKTQDRRLVDFALARHFLTQSSHFTLFPRVSFLFVLPK
jgi:hypothetical protein